MRLPACTALALAVLATAAFAEPAGASLVVPAGSSNGPRVYLVIGQERETNDVVVDYNAAANATRVTDTAGLRLRTLPQGAPAPPAGDFYFCEQRSPTEAVCPGPPGGGQLGDGNDRFEVRGDPSPMRAKVEDLMADPGGSIVRDVVQGVLVSGGPGNDTILGGPGFDQLYGGSEDSFYGTGDDVLVGGDNVDHLVGSDGNDRLDGGAGDDELSANEGDDVVLGGDGRDWLELFVSSNERGYGAGNDRYEGGPGDDVIRSWLGTDRIDGGAGDDEIQLSHYYGDVFGGADDAKRATVDCAQGSDTVEVGRGDTLRGCERLKIHMRCDVCSRIASLVATLRGRRLTLARKRVSHTAPSRTYDTLPFASGARRALARQRSVRVQLRLGSAVVRTFTLTR